MAGWRTLAVIGLAVALAACGGDNAASNDTNTSSPPTATPVRMAAPTVTPERPTLPTLTPGPSPTPIPPAPRSRPVPEVDPYQFEAPFSAGDFIRESMRGNPTAPQGMLATYRRANDALAVTFFHFRTTNAARDAVAASLEAANIVEVIEPLYSAPTIAFGIGRDRQGGHMAVWSHHEWYFQARTSGPLETLNAFLEAFPF